MFVPCVICSFKGSLTLKGISWEFIELCCPISMTIRTGYDDATDSDGDKLCLSPPTKQFKSDNKYDAVDGIRKGSFNTDDCGDVEQNHILEPISQVSKGVHNIVDISFSDSSQSSISDLEESSDDEDLLAIDDDLLYNSLPTPSKLSIKDHGAAVMGFTVRHNISHEAVKDLLTLINLHIPEDSKSFKSFSKLKHAVGIYAYDRFFFLMFVTVYT